MVLMVDELTVEQLEERQKIVRENAEISKEIMYLENHGKDSQLNVEEIASGMMDFFN